METGNRDLHQPQWVELFPGKVPPVASVLGEGQASELGKISVHDRKRACQRKCDAQRSKVEERIAA